MLGFEVGEGERGEGLPLILTQQQAVKIADR